MVKMANKCQAKRAIHVVPPLCGNIEQSSLMAPLAWTLAIDSCFNELIF